MEYYSCFHITFLGCGHNEIHLLPIPYSPTFCKAPTTPTTFPVLNTEQNDLFKDVWQLFLQKDMLESEQFRNFASDSQLAHL